MKLSLNVLPRPRPVQAEPQHQDTGKIQVQGRQPCLELPCLPPPQRQRSPPMRRNVLRYRDALDGQSGRARDKSLLLSAKLGSFDQAVSGSVIRARPWARAGGSMDILLTRIPRPGPTSASLSLRLSLRLQPSSFPWPSRYRIHLAVYICGSSHEQI